MNGRTMKNCVLRFADRLCREVNLHGFLLSASGHMIAGGFRHPFRADLPHRLYSVSKTFTGIAVGMLADDGKLSLDDPVSRYLPAYASLKVRKGGEVHPAERVMTVRHLMSMQSGLDYELDTPAIRRVQTASELILRKTTRPDLKGAEGA